MAAAKSLPLSTVLNVSLSQTPTGISEYNTSNVALFSADPFADTFGTNGYKIYFEPESVATDFGTGSTTYQQALAVFSQQPNILNNDGYLVVIPFIEAQQTWALSGVPEAGSFTATIGSFGTTAAINWNDLAAAIQTKIAALPGLENVVVTGTLASESLLIDFQGVYGPVTAATFGGSGLETSAPAAITITPTTTQAGETLNAAIVRTFPLVSYFGIIANVIVDQADTLAAAATIQTLNAIALFVSNEEADIEPGGRLDLLRTGSFTQSRGIFYGDTSDDGVVNALVMSAAYAGCGFSVNFSGSNTTLTMNLQTLVGIQPDPSQDLSTIYTEAQAAGVDIYANVQGDPSVLCSGTNQFFDQVYNGQWFAGAIAVAGFNYLKQAKTKIPQTEPGMDGLKAAYRLVCEQAVTNQYVAPGTWTAPTTFGVQALFLQQISQVGFYIYSVPLAQQAASARQARQAPLVQIALKEAGAFQSNNVVVNVNP